MQGFTVFGQSAMLLGDPDTGPAGSLRASPAALPGLMGAIDAETVRRSGAMCSVQAPLMAAQPDAVCAELTGQRLDPPRPGPTSVLHRDRDLARSQIERYPGLAEGVPARRVTIAD